MFKLLDMMTSGSKKELLIIAGANGSGKSTFASQLLEVTKYDFLNADEIAKQINPEIPLQSRIAAGRKVISSISRYMLEGKSFLIESTLAGSFLEKYIVDLKKQGYEINLTYVFLGSKELCIERIKSRVMQGGHDVPEEDVRRRYDRGLSKFWSIYRKLADYVTIVFNDDYYDFKRIAHGKKNKLEIINEDLYNKFLSEVRKVKDESK